MHYLYLRAESEQALWDSLENADLAIKENESDDYRFTGIALDIIGTIYEETEETTTDEYGNEYPVMEPIPGYHANLIIDSNSEEYANLPIIDPPPSSPVRIWAGQNKKVN